MKHVMRLSASLLLVALLAAPAATQNPPNRQQLNQQARQVWQQSTVFRNQGRFKEAKIGYDALIQAYATLNMPRFVEASRQMAELCAAMPIDMKKLKDGVFSASAKGYEGDITLEVTVKKGRLIGLRVTQQKESRPLKALDVLPQRIFQTQSPSVDGVSGATITSCSVMAAARRAISQAQPTAAVPKKP